MKKISAYLFESFEELKKVTWPKREEVVKLLLLVISVTAVVALYAGGVDLLLTKTLEKIISK